jgi:plastocyanin
MVVLRYFNAYRFLSFNYWRFPMFRSSLLILAVLPFLTAPALAAEIPNVEITIKNHQFTPAEVKVPAGKKFTLLVKNQDATAEEFESHSLKREKVIAGNSQATIKIGPLKAGSYEFVGEFHEATAKGKIIAE